MSDLVELVNLSKRAFYFDPDSVAAVFMQPGAAGSHTTIVWPVYGQEQQVTGSPGDIVARYGFAKEFIKLTTLGGEIWIRRQAIDGIHAPFPGDAVKQGVHCMML